MSICKRDKEVFYTFDFDCLRKEKWELGFCLEIGVGKGEDCAYRLERLAFSLVHIN